MGQQVCDAPLAQSGIVELTTGDQHSCVLRSSGQVSCWGFNDNGKLGGGFNQFGGYANVRFVIDLGGVVQIASGRNHNCALDNQARVFCWGNNNAGQPGNNSFNTTPRRIQVIGLPQISEIALGNNHSCARAFDGRTFCWGANAAGQLGNNSIATSPIPIEVILPLGLVTTRTLNSGAVTFAGDAISGDDFDYILDVPAGVATVKIQTGTTTGDADLYVKLGQRPTFSAFDREQNSTSGNETCLLTVPSTGGQFYITVLAYSDLVGLSVTGSFGGQGGEFQDGFETLTK